MAARKVTAEVSARVLGAEERRLRILRAATRLFDAKGFEGTTTDEVAAAAQVTKKTLYRYVGSKEQLLFEIHDEFLANLLNDVKSLSGGPEARLRAMMVAHLREVAAHLPEIKVFFEEVKHLTQEKRGELVARRRSYERLFADILEAGVADGVFDVDDVPLTTRAVLGALNESYRWFDPAGDYSPDRVGELMADLFLHGLGPAGAPRKTLGSRFTVPVLERPAPDSLTPLDRVAQAATRLFREKGYHGTNTRELAEAAGITKGALFYHASSKDEILVRIHTMLGERRVAAFSQVDRRDRPSDEVLARMIVSQTQLVFAEQDANAVVSEEMKYLPPEPLKRARYRQGAYANVLNDVIVEGLRQGELETDDAHISCFATIGMINSTYRWYRPDKGLSPAAFGRALAELVLNGVVVRKRARRTRSSKR